MKTKFKILAISFILSLPAGQLFAYEIKNLGDIVPESKLEVEKWMTDDAFFEVKPDDGVSGSVVEIAISNPDFSILVEAVTKAELGGALSADGPFTVFAPTNDAFNALFKDLGVDGIEDLSAEQLTPILTYHVVSGKVMSSDLSNTSVPTLNGKEIKVDLSDGVKINESKVIKADISGDNGVVHVIDKVLLPPAEEAKNSGCSN